MFKSLVSNSNCRTLGVFRLSHNLQPNCCGSLIFAFNDNRMWCLSDHKLLSRERFNSSTVWQDSNKIFADEIVPIFIRLGII